MPPREVGGHLTLVRDPLLEHERALEAHRALEQERCPLTAHAAFENSSAKLAVPWQQRDLTVEGNRLATVRRLVVRAGKELLPAARIAIEERRPVGVGWTEPPGSLEEQLGPGRRVNE